jgi:hypothetical protein
VELQRGSLDRYHLYKVLDYFDQYKDRHPQQFVEVMVVANLITAERKARLASRGVEFREIPAEVFHRYLGEGESADIPTAIQPSEDAAGRDDATPRRSDRITTLVPREEYLRDLAELPDLPPWFVPILEQLNVKLQGHMRLMIRHYPPRDDQDWLVHAAAADYMKTWSVTPPPTQYQPERLFNGSGALTHLYLHFRGVGDAALERASGLIAEELVPLLRLYKLAEAGAPGEFFRQREALISSMASEALDDPPFLLRLCASLYSLWRSAAAIEPDYARALLAGTVAMCLVDIVKEVSLKIGGSQRILIGIDEKGTYVLRDLKLRWHKTPVALFPAPSLPLWPSVHQRC